MTLRPLLIFKTAAPGLRREVAYLGDIPAGEVAPFPGGRDQKAAWMMRLPDASRLCGPAKNLDVGREAIRRHVEEWLMRAGLIAAGDRVEVLVEEPTPARKVVKR